MEIINVIMDCTCLDARNPCNNFFKTAKIEKTLLIFNFFYFYLTVLHQWSILAIRNLCESNSENQYIIANLVKIGDATNSNILKEFDISLGSMRISGDECKTNTSHGRH